MKKILTLILFLCQLKAFAGPGDDVWVKIAELSTGISIANASITSLQQQIQKLNARVESLPAPTRYQAGNGISIEGNVIHARPANQHQIGEVYRGGIIFYVDESGEHGLIAGKRDTGKGLSWRNGVAGNRVTNARADGIGAGDTNTRLIIAQQTIDDQKGSFAALAAVGFQVMEDGLTLCKTPVPQCAACYSGWYLPSAYELQLMYKNLAQQGVSNFSPEFYWSSTEADVSNAWLQNFSTGELFVSSKADTTGRVRPIARF